MSRPRVRVGCIGLHLRFLTWHGKPLFKPSLLNIFEGKQNLRLLEQRSVKHEDGRPKLEAQGLKSEVGIKFCSPRYRHSEISIRGMK